MSVFTDEERRYLLSGVALGRLATVGPDPGIEIRGEAEVLDTGGAGLGPGFAPQMFRITTIEEVT